MYLMVYAEQSGKTVANTARDDADLWSLRNACSSDVCITPDNVESIVDRIKDGEISRLIIYGDDITGEIMQLVFAAFERGIPISRCSFHWTLQPVCSGCKYRENTAGDQRYIGSTNSCCTYHLQHDEGRKAPPLGDWCPYKEKG